MRRVDTDLPGVWIFEPKVFGDARGFFLESYNRRVFSDLGVTCEFVQDNHSRSRGGVLRGLHYQLGRAQDKLVRVVDGVVFDVAVDVRWGSPTFGRWTGVELSAENKRMFFVPKGFAHGFVVLSESADFCYKCSDFYAPECERGVAWNDGQIGIDWPLPAGMAPTLSDKDRVHPPLVEVPQDDLPVWEDGR